MGIKTCVKVACTARDESSQFKVAAEMAKDASEAALVSVIASEEKTREYMNSASLFSQSAESAAERAEAAVPIGEGYSQSYIDSMLDAIITPIVALTIINSTKG